MKLRETHGNYLVLSLEIAACERQVLDSRQVCGCKWMKSSSCISRSSCQISCISQEGSVSVCEIHSWRFPWCHPERVILKNEGWCCAFTLGGLAGFTTSKFLLNCLSKPDMKSGHYAPIMSDLKTVQVLQFNESSRMIECWVSVFRWRMQAPGDRIHSKDEWDAAHTRRRMYGKCRC